MNPTSSCSEPSLRVALIDDVLEVPAHERWAADIARHRIEKLSLAFARHGHCVDIYRARTPGEPVWEDLHAGVRIHRVTERVPWAVDDQTQLSHSVMAFVNRIQCLACNIYPCDVIHAWGPMAGLIGLRLNRVLRGTPFVLNMNPAGPTPSQSSEMPPHWRTLSAIESLLVHRADQVLASSDLELEDLLDAHGAEANDSLRTVAFGVDTQTFKPIQKQHARRQLGLPEDAFIVLWGNLLTSDIGAVKAATSFMQTLQEDQVGHLLLVGAGMRQPPQPISHMGHTSMFDLAGEGVDCVETLHAAYAAADVMVLPPTDQMRNGMSPKEAMSCGTPVIAVGCNQNDELVHVIVDGVTGYILYRQDPHSILHLLQELKEQPSIRAAMSTAALLRARTFFTWDRTVHQLLRVYERARLHSPPAPVSSQHLTLIRSNPLGLTPESV